MDPEKLGKAYHRAVAKEAKETGRKRPLDSNLEARFVTLLKAQQVTKWERDQVIPGLGTEHEADFSWRSVKPVGERKTRTSLFVCIDGPVHGLRGRLADTLRCVNLCALLPPDITVFRFADSQLELGARVVAAWHEGAMGEMVKMLRGGR